MLGIYELAFGSPEWDEISDTAKDLITVLLDKDPSKRPSASQLKKHPWVSGGKAPQRTLTNNIHRTISRYIEFNKMKTKMGGRHQRRVSIYGLFNIARSADSTTLLVPPTIGEDEPLVTTTSHNKTPRSSDQSVSHGHNAELDLLHVCKINRTTADEN